MAGCVNKLRCPGFQPSVHSLLPSPSPGDSWKSLYLISLSRSHLINFCQELCLETKRKGSNENVFQTNKENVNSVATLKLSRSGKASLGPPQRESRSKWRSREAGADPSPGLCHRPSMPRCAKGERRLCARGRHFFMAHGAADNRVSPPGTFSTVQRWEAHGSTAAFLSSDLHFFSQTSPPL